MSSEYYSISSLEDLFEDIESNFETRVEIRIVYPRSAMLPSGVQLKVDPVLNLRDPKE